MESAAGAKAGAGVEVSVTVLPPHATPWVAQTHADGVARFKQLPVSAVRIEAQDLLAVPNVVFRSRSVNLLAGANRETLSP